MKSFMKAIGYFKAHNLDEFQFEVFDVQEPELKPDDILVRVHGISVNPVDYKIRQNRSSSGPAPVILGWDGAGVVEKVGSRVSKFKIGDEVFYAGDLGRAGSYSELQAVDSRIAAHKPKSLSFAQAAALPLTALTAYEALLADNPFNENSKVLILGGAGGVGSMAIQLLKALTPATVVATASRPESQQWCRELGADHVVDHSKLLEEELTRIGILEYDHVFSTNRSEKYFSILLKILKPFAQFTLIDDPDTFDIRPLKTKSIRVRWEFMFTRTMFSYQESSQGEILAHIAKLVDQGKIRTTLTRELKGFSIDNIRTAHQILESGASIGKVVIRF